VQTDRRLGLEAFVALLVLVASTCTGSSPGPTPSTSSASLSPSPSPQPPIVLHGRLAFANDRDGKRIAFRSDRRRNDEVFVMNADGTRQRDLTNNPHSDYSPAWSPDGRTIAFATDRRGRPNDLWLMDADEGNQRPLVEQRGIDEYPTWSQDGSQLTFGCTLGKILASRVGDFEVCVVNADGTGLRRITDARGISAAAGWSPDGSLIFLGSNRDQNPGDVTTCGDIFVIHPDGTGLRKLTDGSQTYCLTSVSSDGHIFFSSDRRDHEGESDLWVMNADGTRATLVAAIPGNEQDGTFLPASTES
jgi:Tol biopolymer transport system component